MGLRETIWSDEHAAHMIPTGI